MSTPYVGEIRMFGGNFPPAGWAFCDGSLLPISENETLFQLIGTTYGGDGEATFALPDLRGRVPFHQGSGYTVGESGGAEAVTLTSAQLPAHSHQVRASAEPGSSTSPAGNVWAAAPDLASYGATPDASMHANSVTPAGGSQPHDNMAPFLGVSFIISQFGIFPTPS